MDEKKFEKLLHEIYMENVTPSPDLIQKTKNRVKEDKTVYYLVALVIMLNIIMTFSLVIVLVFIPYHFIVKTILYLGTSGILNILIVPIYFYQDHLKGFFASEKFVDI